ncbi:MAG: hemerythrin domain-containing protein [Gammaproteobacteria bacterium]|nr:hemerythrin domain-containing protein [Gammaproteobacteria bacterium]
MSLESLTPTPAAGFDMPLAILSACHDRILRFCDMLERLAEHIQNNGVDLQAVETAKLIHKYFSTAGKHHHEDEEKDLFPLLLHHDEGLGSLLSRLVETHRQLDSNWEQLEPILLSLDTIESNKEAFTILTYSFATSNRNHIQLENRELLPCAALLLSNTDNEYLGQAMAKRRGVPYRKQTKI